MQSILQLAPLFKERIWGGVQLKTLFGYPIPSVKTGECWAISGLSEESNQIMNGPLKGKSLREVYQTMPYLFGHPTQKEFPLLTKIIDACTDLSVQVHPSDEFARKLGQPYGKSECWLVLDCKEDASIIYGHEAQSVDEFQTLINQGAWNDLLQEVKVKKGDFIDVPAGVIHALKGGIVVLETQQSSDTTYRLYDYDRVDDLGNKRELHLLQAIDVSLIPHLGSVVSPKITTQGLNQFIHYVNNDNFTVMKVSIQEPYEYVVNQYTLVSVLSGSVQIDHERFHQGDHVILTMHKNKMLLQGNAELLVSIPHQIETTFEKRSS